MQSITAGFAPAILVLRPVRPEDASFLLEVYASTREDELALVDWSDEQKRAFVRMQFEAQTRYYVAEYPGASFQVVQLAGHPVGRLYLHRRAEEIRVMDLALLPSHRGRGFGTALLEAVLREGAEHQKRVTVHAEAFNPALRLYSRLGFQRVATRGLYHLLEWRPPAETRDMQRQTIASSTRA